MPQLTAMPTFIPRELREPEDTPELAQLRDLVMEYDDLMEDCMSMRLSREEQKGLDDLIATLNALEHAQWHGVPDETVEMIESHSDGDVDYPMVRLMLGFKPSDY